MVLQCRLGANLFPHCQMVKRVREKGEGKKGAPLDDDAAATDASRATRHMAENLALRVAGLGQKVQKIKCFS